MLLDFFLNIPSLLLHKVPLRKARPNQSKTEILNEGYRAGVGKGELFLRDFLLQLSTKENTLQKIPYLSLVDIYENKIAKILPFPWAGNLKSQMATTPWFRQMNFFNLKMFE